jgi:hypothetical protein
MNKRLIEYNLPQADISESSTTDSAHKLYSSWDKPNKPAPLEVA